MIINYKTTEEKISPGVPKCYQGTATCLGLNCIYWHVLKNVLSCICLSLISVQCIKCKGFFFFKQLNAEKLPSAQDVLPFSVCRHPRVCGAGRRTRCSCSPVGTHLRHRPEELPPVCPNSRRGFGRQYVPLCSDGLG